MDTQTDNTIFFRKYIQLFIICNIAMVLPLFVGVPAILILMTNFVCTIMMFWYMRLSIDSSTISSAAKYLVFLLLFWNIISIIRSFELDYRIYGRMLSSPDFMLPFILPIFVFLKNKFDSIRAINKTIILFNIIYLLGLLVFLAIPVKLNIFESLNDYEFFSKHFAYANGFLLLTYGYQNKKVKVLSIVVFLVSLIIALTLARRSQVLVISLFGVLGWFLSVFYINRKKFFLNLIIYSAVICIVYFGFASQISNLFNNSFSFFIERIDDNTRDFATDQFYADMKPIDYVVGRGINGRYKSVEDLDSDYEGDTRTEEEKQYRYGIETGYLNIILKGGTIALVFTVLIFMLAIVKGFFKSTNGYVKACSLFVFVNLVALYPESSLAFTLRYLLIWIFIGFCVSINVDYTEDQIKELLNDNNNKLD